MKFRFRFETLLDLRRRRRDEAGVAVGQAHEAIAKIDKEREEVNSKRTELRQRAAAARSGRISVDRLLTAGRYDMQLEADDQSLLQTRGELVQELARRQQKLIAAEAELKRFEKLREQDLARLKAELRRREQNEADDATGRRYAMAIQRGEK